jgi:hypothetical protein
MLHAKALGDLRGLPDAGQFGAAAAPWTERVGPQQRTIAKRHNDHLVLVLKEARSARSLEDESQINLALRMADGHQVNLLAVSEEPKERLIELMLGRWVQENGFKHANERWGINQLDGRRVESYPPASPYAELNADLHGGPDIVVASAGIGGALRILRIEGLRHARGTPEGV